MYPLTSVDMRLCRLFNERGERSAAQVQIILAHATHGSQDVAAAIGLLHDEECILAQVRVVSEFLGQFGTGEFDRGQRRAQLMRCGGNHAAQIGQFLFTRQGHLRRLQGVGHGAHFLHDPSRIDSEEKHRDDNRHPIAKAEYIRHRQNETVLKPQWQIELHQERDDHDRHRAEKSGGAPRERGGRHRDRPHNQDRERIVQPAREIEQ